MRHNSCIGGVRSHTDNPGNTLRLADFILIFDTISTSENTLREFPLVIATVAKVSRKRGLRLVVCVKKAAADLIPPQLFFSDRTHP